MLKKIIIAVVILGIIGAGAAYFFIADPFGLHKDTANNTPDDTTNTGTYKEQASFNAKQEEVAKLVAPGKKNSAASVKEADDILDGEVRAAEASRSDAYIVESNLAKASLLINTGRQQNALDNVLTPLLQRYGNSSYKYDIYGYMSWVYRELGNPSKAEEYYKKIPVKDFD